MIKHLCIVKVFFVGLSLLSGLTIHAQTAIEEGDPPNPTDIPAFYKSTLSDLETELLNIRKGEKELIATSPGGLPVHAVYYGQKANIASEANYNSAVAARDLSQYSKKDSSSRPVIFLLGPVHGQEAEGLVGLINLIHIAETGKDYRGREFVQMKSKMDRCRIIVVPCGNPDGRHRCPYDSFLGLPTSVMTKYGQGTHKDGSSWGWPGAKSLHPMKGDVGILGAYFNDDGINMMHDDFFAPMAVETSAILDLARNEAPDMTVSLHSHENRPRILQASYEPWFMKQRIDRLTRQVNQRYLDEGLPGVPSEWIGEPEVEDKTAPPRASFNLISALHHVSGTMAFTFECSHGTLSDRFPEPFVDYEDILDIQLILYDEILNFALKNKK
jgi:hypothetical protein